MWLLELFLRNVSLRYLLDLSGVGIQGIKPTEKMCQVSEIVSVFGLLLATMPCVCPANHIEEKYNDLNMPWKVKGSVCSSVSNYYLSPRKRPCKKSWKHVL